MDKAWCYKSQSVPLVPALGYTYRGGQGLVLQVTICTLGFSLRLYLQRWTGFSVTSHSLYPWFLFQVILTEVDRVWCYKSQSVPLVPVLDFLTELDRAWCNKSQSVPLVPVLVFLKEVDRVWCYKSQSVPLVSPLGYTYRGGQGLVLQVSLYP